MKRIALKMEMIIEQVEGKLPKPLFDQAFQAFLKHHDLKAEWWTNAHPNWQIGPAIHLHANLFYPSKTVPIQEIQSLFTQWLEQKTWIYQAECMIPHPYQYQKKYEMWVDYEGKAFLEEMMQQLMLQFGLDEVEACKKIRTVWANVNHLFELDIIFHEEASYWVESIYHKSIE